MNNIDLLLSWGFDVSVSQEAGGALVTLRTNELNTSHCYTATRPSFNGHDNVFRAATTEKAVAMSMEWVKGWLR